jgi:hypothetical protein
LLSPSGEIDVNGVTATASSINVIRPEPLVNDFLSLVVEVPLALTLMFRHLSCTGDNIRVHILHLIKSYVNELVRKDASDSYELSS